MAWQKDFGKLNETLVKMAEAISNMAESQQELAEAISGEKEMYVDPETGTKRVRRVK